MKSALRTKLDGGTTEFRLDTLGGLTVRELIDSEGSLTTAGWNQAVAALPLQEQCAHLGIGYERLEGLRFKGQPEYAAWEYFKSKGYEGGYCEGGAILLLIRAAALDIFAKLYSQESTYLYYDDCREDACRGGTEGQLTVHQNHANEILVAIRKSTPRKIAKHFKEISAVGHSQSSSGLTVDVMVALFKTLGANCLAIITSAIMEDPYKFRSGWPDLTMTNRKQMLWLEIKTTDKLHMNQIQTLNRMKSLLPGEIRVIKLC